MLTKQQVPKLQKVAIIILNWNGKSDTLECLQSLQKLSYGNYEIVVVDNGSVDGSPEAIQQHFPAVTLLRNKENLGFTGGNNVGIQYALDKKAEYIILLNNDTSVEHNLVTAMLDCFNKDQRIGIVGPKVVYYDYPEKVWCAGGSYNAILGKGRMYGHDTYPKKRFDDERQVGWISFCVVMIKAEVFGKIGLLSDQYFSSNEDLDFCINAKKVGLVCYYTPQTVVKHKIASDWGGLDNPLYIYYQVRNTLLFYKKNRVGIAYIISLFYYLFLSVPKRAFLLFQNKYPERSQYLLYAIADFFLGNYGKGRFSELISNAQKPKVHGTLRVGINARYLQRPKSGIERYAEELIIHLSVIDKENEYILFFNNHLPLPTLTLSENFKKYISPFPTKYRLLRLIWEHFFLYFEIKKQKIDVFHGPSFFVPFWKPKNCKYIITVHDLTFISHPKTFTLGTRFYYKLFLRRSLHLADTLIAVSEKTKSDFLDYFHVPANDIEVIYHGVGKHFFRKSDGNVTERIREKYALPEKYFLAISVLSPRKNVERIIDAFAQFIRNNSNLNHNQNKNKKLVIIGRKGWLYETIFKKVDALNVSQNILFRQDVPEEDLLYIYHSAEVFLYPSLSEGFGLPILEAMASGCPVITSNVSSMPEVAGNAACLVNPLSVEEIKEAMEKITCDRKFRAALIQNGLQRVKVFTWEKTAEATLHAYKEASQKGN